MAIFDKVVDVIIPQQVGKAKEDGYHHVTVVCVDIIIVLLWEKTMEGRYILGNTGKD